MLASPTTRVKPNTNARILAQTMSNFTLEDILAEEDPATLPSNQNISIEDILAEDLDKETEKILRELKQKAATPAVNNLPANNNNNQNPTTSKQFIQKEDLQTTSTCKNSRYYLL